MDDKRSSEQPPPSPATRPSQTDAVDQTLNTLHGQSAAPPSNDSATHGLPTDANRTQLTLGAVTVNTSASPGPALSGYEILGELGQGGMGVVYKARHVKANRIVALKMIRGSYATMQEKVRFQIEAEAIARLQHPNIVQLCDVGEVEGQPFFSLEFCAGGSLDKRLKTWQPTPTEAAELVETLARAMHYAHLRGVVHRDLKPANVLLVGEPGIVLKITDFGLAKRTDSGSDLSKSGAIMGTPSYMAPEQAEGKVHDTGPAADVYALGALLYECLSGRPPFKADTAMETLRQVLNDEPAPPSRHGRNVPRDLKTICLKCLQKEPGRRYPDAEALADDLARFRNGEPIQACPISRLVRAAKWAKRRPAVAALLLVTVLGVAGIVWKYVDAERQKSIAEGERERAEKLATNLAEKKEIAEQKTEAALKAEKKAKTELDRAEGLVYAGNLLQAQLLWEAGEIWAARDRLNACRWDYRGWEHSHLRHQFDETCVTLRRHEGSVYCVGFSPDGRLLAAGGGDPLVAAAGSGNPLEPGTVTVWETATGQKLLSLKGHTGTVFSVCFSPDGKSLATASLDKTVKVWDAATGQNLLTLNGHTRTVHHVRFSPDGETLASASSDKTVKVWDAATGEELFSLKGHTSSVDSLCYSPNGKQLASGSDDTTVMIWNAATGEVVRTLKGHEFGIRSVVFSPDGKHLASVSKGDSTLKVRNVATGQEVITFNGVGESVCFSPDGQRLCGAGLDRTVKMWDAVSGKELLSFKGHTHTVHSVVFSPDGRELASGSDDMTVKLWDATAKDLRNFQEHADIVSACFSRDGKRMAGANLDHTVQVWDVATGEDLYTLKCHTNSLWSGCFSSDGMRLASGGHDKTVKLWDMATGKELHTLTGHTGIIRSVCFSLDRKRLASASDDQTVKVWDAVTGQELRTLKGHKDRVTCVVFSPDGKRLASASDDETVKVWDMATGQDLLSLQGHTSVVKSVNFSPDGKHLASASQDRTVKVGDATTGQDLLSLQGHTSVVESVCFSADGKRLASASQDRTVKIWDAVTGQELLSLKGDIRIGASLCFSLDGQRLTSAGHDGSGKMWDAAMGQERFVLKGHTGDVTSVGFSADGNRIVSRDAKGEVRSWDAVSGQAIVPRTDPPPKGELRTATSADGSLLVSSDGSTIQVIRTADKHPSSDLVFLAQLNDIPACLRWHRAEAAESETKQQWFAAAFHLRQLIAAKEADADKLHKRLKHCEERLRQP